MEIYELVIEDLTTLGRMGSEPRVKETKLFEKANDAKAYAEADYGKSIKWKGYSDRITSPDLSYVMYIIWRREVA